MHKILSIAVVLFGLTSCWPTRVSFVDVSMPEEWKSFTVKTLENNTGNAPLSYNATLTELIKDGIQNNSRLSLEDNVDNSEVNIEGIISSYTITPVALQEGDAAAQNRLTVTVQFEIFISEPEEDIMELTSSRFIDYDANTDLGTVENELLSEVSDQIVQDVLNKLFSNW
ncbi:MAG: LPS assembly lipoprotein LptE [bacterium]|nr:LPS assembly lipoprotein LptE [bacterium]